VFLSKFRVEPLSDISTWLAVGLYWVPGHAEYEVMRSPTSWQGAALFWGLLDQSRPWESLDRIYEEELVVGWSTTIGYDGEVLAIPKDRLEN
jgi:hypothetical protein